MLALGLVVIGIVSRVIFHEHNFTPALAIALFAGCFLSKRQAIIVPVVLFIIADCIIGFHKTIFFTWGSVALIAWIGMSLREDRTWVKTAIGTLAAAVLFFVVTNFGVWLLYETYPKTLAGLVECYVAAIPFFRNTFVSTFLYAFVLFGGYEWAVARIKGTRYATVLLK